MKKIFRIIIALFLLAPIPAYPQLFINKTRGQVKKEISKVFTENYNIAETDSSLVVKVRGTGAPGADHIYRFDKSGKCNFEKTITSCDSCHEKLLQQVLDVKKYQWKKINLNQYISDFTTGVFLEIQIADNVFSFTIYRTNFSKKMYRFLLENN